MAKAYYQIVEVNPAGTEVAVYSLGSGLTWNVASNVNGDLKYFQMNTTLGNPGSTFGFSITFFISAVTGRIDLANTEVDPRMLESVIRISGYSYASASNNLALKVAAIHKASEYADSQDRVSTGSDLHELYVSLDNKCHEVDNDTALIGTVRSVAVGSWVSSTAAKAVVALSDIAPFLNEKLGSDWDVRVAVVEFPPGATNIVYDPTLGASATKAVSSPASSLALPSALFLLIAILGSFLF